MRVLVRIVAASVIVFLLAACSDSVELFSALDEPSDVRVSTVESGSVLEPGSAFTVQLDYPEEEFQALTSVTIEIFDRGSLPVYEDVIDEGSLAYSSVTTFEIPELEEGPYRLVVTAYRGQEVVLTEARTVFVLDETPEITAVAIHPSVPAPGTAVLAIAELSIHDTLVPYLRWRFNGATIVEGYVDDGSDRVQITLPDEPGVYAVKVDLYPWGPEEGVDVALESLITQSVEVFVRRSADGTLSEDAILRYEFDGTAGPIGAVGTLPSVETESEPTFSFVEGALGLLVGADTGVTVPLSIVPAQNGVVVTELSIYTDTLPDDLVFTMVAQSFTLSGTLTVESRELRVVVDSGEESVEGVLALGTEYPLREIAITVTRTSERFELAIEERVAGEVLELVIPNPNGAPVETGPVDERFLLEPGEIRVGGGEELLLNRVTLSAGSTATRVRLDLIRGLVRQGASEGVQIATTFVPADDATKAAGAGDSETSERQIDAYSIPVPSQLALGLAIGGEAATIGTGDGVSATIVRNGSGYTIATSTDSIALSSEPVFVFEIVEDGEELLLDPGSGGAPIPIGPASGEVVFGLRSGGLALLEPINE